MKKITMTIAVCTIAVAATFTLLYSCTKDKSIGGIINNKLSNGPAVSVAPAQGANITRVLTVANIRNSANGFSQVMFCENPQILSVQDAATLTILQQALQSKVKVKVTFNPWQAKVVQVNTPSATEIATATSGPIVSNQGLVLKVDKNTNTDDLDNAEKLGLLNENTHQALTNVIPNMATAETIFNYIAKQCCKLSGPYAIDYCISFQYCEDGCYARAQKMCEILNTTYHYATHKIFSFANVGSDVLSVEAEKWGGCCINWWFHVTTLVSINTPGGVKAYVFDPAMFDQPVLLSTWLHAQENPTCAGGNNPNVSMINLQPNSSYTPTDGTGLYFDTDPYNASTDTTLVHYSPLVTCP